MGLCDILDEKRQARYALAGCIGALIGIVTSFTVNCTLVEISITSFFAVYFGLLFILIAGVIMWRVSSGTHPKPYLLVAFAALVFVSGMLCFVLQRDWFVRMHWLSKVPVYALLGASVTFALLFAVVDLINTCSGNCVASIQARPLIETETQVYLVVATSLLMGFLFGLIFGMLDIEDEELSHIKVKLLQEHRICYPIGAILGGAAAIANQYLRENADDHKFDPLKDTAQDDDLY